MDSSHQTQPTVKHDQSHDIPNHEVTGEHKVGKGCPAWELLLTRLLLAVFRPALCRMLQRTMGKGRLKIVLPDDIQPINVDNTADTGAEAECDQYDEGEWVELRLIRPIKTLLRLVFDARVGLGEAYMHGEWEATPTLQAFFNLLIANRATRRTADRRLGVAARLFYWVMQRLGWLLNYMRHIVNWNSIRGSRRNIERHYDLGNEMFKLFLDDTMTYSCAFFDSPEMSLEEAQKRKLDMILDDLQPNRDDSILEIGFGWGSCAIRAMERSVCRRWTGLTVSEHQWRLAQQRVQQHGYGNCVDLKLLDYREETGVYDGIVSIEMLEAVGERYLPVYFDTLCQRLTDKGRAVIQAITIPDSQYASYCRKSDFIRKHIFPGGHLPSVAAIKELLPAAGLRLVSIRRIGRHYAPTLDSWANAWTKPGEQMIVSLGYDGVFYRKWQYYFRMCSSLFQNDYIDVVQLVLMKE